jgi:hypothetical protein
VHGYYLTPNGNDELSGLPYGYTDDDLQAAINDPANRQTYGDTTYVLIPAKGTLPLLRPIEDLAGSAGLAPIVKPFISLFNPILKELVNLGYDRSINRGIPTWASPLPFNPFQNWVEVGIRLIVAAAQGVQAFIADLGGLTTMVAPPAPSPEPLSTLAAAAPIEAEDATTPLAKSSDPDEETTKAPTLALVRDEADAVEEETTPSTADEPAVTKPEDEKKTDPAETPEVTEDDVTLDDETPAKADDDKDAEADDENAEKADAEKDADDKKADNQDADNEKAAA